MVILTSNLPLLIIIYYYMFLILSVFLKAKITPKQWKISSVIFIIAIVFLTYNFIPDPTLDLFRYYHYLEEIKSKSWEEIFSYGTYSNTILTQIYFYIISITGNYSLLSTISTTMLFTIILYVINKYQENSDFSYSAASFFIVSIISVATLAGITSGIRQNFSWVLLMIAVYYDFFSRKDKLITRVLLYILPLMVHMSTLPFIALRLIMPIIKKYPWLKYGLFFWQFGIIIADRIKGVLPEQLLRPVNHLILYVNLSFNPSLTFMLTFVSYLLIFYFIYKLSKETNFKEHNLTYFNFYTSVAFFGFASFLVPTLFTRTFEFLMYISLPIYSQVIRTEFRFKKAVVSILLIIFMLMFYYTDLHAGYPFLR